MKKQTILNYIMATVIVVLLFYIRTSADYPGEQPIPEPLNLGSTGCRYDEVSGFGAARLVTREAASAQAAAFRTFAGTQNNTIFGGVISKASLDSLFCGGAYNGLAYQLAMDPSGKHGPAKAIFVLVGGVNVQAVQGVPTITGQSNRFYTNNLWCPPSCLSFQ